MLVAALLALLGWLGGILVVSPLVGLVIGGGGGDLSYDEETRHMQIFVGVGQLVGVGAVVGWGCGPIVGGIAGLAAGGLAWIMTPASHATHNGLVMLVPPALGGALAAAIGAALLG